MGLTRVALPTLSTLLPQPGFAAGTALTMDAAGESNFIIGIVEFEDGSASKTFDTSCFIHWIPGTTTFANGTTNLRGGIQDVDVGTGLEDGTFDVQFDLVGGTDTITAGTWRRTQMESGSKSLTRNGLYAFGFEMTARGGADSVQLSTIAAPFRGSVSGFPYRTADTGSGPTKANTSFNRIMLEFADGTIGWIVGLAFTSITNNASTINFNAGTSPDEYGIAFQLPVDCSIIVGGLDISNVAGTDTFTYALYGDPFGSPTGLHSAVIDPDVISSTGAGPLNCNWPLDAEIDITANTWYCWSVIPATANNITISYYALPANCGVLKRATPFGANCKFVSRTNLTGAFSETSPDDLPIFYFNISRLFKDTGGSGGGIRLAGHGGLAA